MATDSNIRLVLADDLRIMMKSSEDFILVDVREDWEYNEGHIPGAIRITVDTIGNGGEGVVSDLDSMLIVYCTAGPRSAYAAQLLYSLGYTTLCELSGGIMSWPYEMEV